MKKIITKKRVSYFIFGIVGVYILAVGISAVMMSQTTQITYDAHGEGLKLRTIVIDFKENTAQNIYYNLYDVNLGLPLEIKEYPINTSTKLQIKTVCSFSLFPLWRKNYYNYRILDGDEYYITITYGNNERVIYGANSYPLTYRPVMWIIRKTVK